ncbi:MAG: glycosyltransferase, partial [Alphaproteobacteria bacterium]|nr:glycosyltransferase [Alphaproteobacteria bacterium]
REGSSTTNESETEVSRSALKKPMSEVGASNLPLSAIKAKTRAEIELKKRYIEWRCRMKLSVITICYMEKNIARTCESILKQKNQDFEWIVIDGGSTDGTLKILQRYASRIDKLISEPDGGIYNAMNKGVKLAKGEFVNFMNGGDEFYDDYATDNFLTLDTYRADVVYGNVCITEQDGSHWIKKYPAQPNKDFFYWDSLGHQGCFIARKLLVQNGYDEHKLIVSDWKKWLEFVRDKKRFVYLDKTIARFYLTGVSKQRPLVHAFERCQVTQEFFSFPEIWHNEMQKIWPSRSYKLLRMAAITLLWLGYKIDKLRKGE